MKKYNFLIVLLGFLSLFIPLFSQAQLTRDQIIQGINSMERQGATQEEVQAWINSQVGKNNTSQSNQDNVPKTFDDLINASPPTTNNDGLIPYYISGLIGIPFILIFLIGLIISGSSKTALKSAFVVVLIGLLIGFLFLIF